jgi:glycosyltransferase involved in cell wall biosynthesis
MTAAERPRISVVVRCYGEDANLDRCLDSLARQTLRGELEVILTEGAGERIATAHPFARVLPKCGRRTPEDLLKECLVRARGDFVAVTDSRCTFPTDWLERLRRAHAAGFPVVGGTVSHAGPENLTAWAAYFADYGPFMPPASRRETFLLAGNHVSYTAELVRETLGAMKGGYWKVFFHEDLEKHGVRSLFDPELSIARVQAESFAQFSFRYFRNGREFACRRVSRISSSSRLLHAITVPLLPPLLLYRRLRAVWPKRTRRMRLALSIPLLAVSVTAWSAGEIAGYVTARQSHS